MFDNRATAPGFTFGWGYSVFIRPLGLLFDTGSETPSLIKNLNLFGIEPAEIEIIFLSHFHWDHTGGLLGLLPFLNEPEVVVHSAFSQGFLSEVKRLGRKITHLDNPSEIAKGALSTGLLKGPLPEAGIILQTPRGNLLLTGCAHPGIVYMTEQAIKISGHIHMVMGGFHLLRKPAQEVIATAQQLKKLGVLKVAPSHCTGKKAEAIFEEIFSEDFISVGAGSILSF